VRQTFHPEQDKCFFNDKDRLTRIFHILDADGSGCIKRDDFVQLVGQIAAISDDDDGGQLVALASVVGPSLGGARLAGRVCRGEAKEFEKEMEELLARGNCGSHNSVVTLSEFLRVMLGYDDADDSCSTGANGIARPRSPLRVRLTRGRALQADNIFAGTQGGTARTSPADDLTVPMSPAARRLAESSLRLVAATGRRCRASVDESAPDGAVETGTILNRRTVGGQLEAIEAQPATANVVPRDEDGEGNYVASLGGMSDDSVSAGRTAMTVRDMGT
jgi:hypothetical protein